MSGARALWLKSPVRLSAPTQVCVYSFWTCFSLSLYVSVELYTALCGYLVLMFNVVCMSSIVRIWHAHANQSCCICVYCKRVVFGQYRSHITYIWHLNMRLHTTTTTIPQATSWPGQRPSKPHCAFLAYWKSSSQWRKVSCWGPVLLHNTVWWRWQVCVLCMYSVCIVWCLCVCIVYV